MASTTEPLLDLVQKWLVWDKDPNTRNEIVQLQNAGNTAELEKRLRKRIQFGTAGLRGTMQAGFSCMNSLTVIQASQGLAKYIKQTYTGSETPSVVIGRDARHNSEKFASLTANAFDAEGIRVWYYEKPSPTPFVPYGVILKGATAGVMVTASHNPAKDNGYKVYYANGAQINSPMDSQIAEMIGHNLKPWDTAWNSLKQGRSINVVSYEFVAKEYCKTVCQYVSSIGGGTASFRPAPCVYTPLHGVGFATMDMLCKELNIDNITTISEQQEPDPNFTTVKFPNPEETGALDLAMQTADKLGRDLIIANDPDADRFAAAEKVNGSWFRLTGDQVGVLLASYLLDQLPPAKDRKKPLAMLNTAVSAGMLLKMAKTEGFHFQETLTGFKWLGNVAKDLESKGYEVPYAFEEALGYMFTAVNYDKDGLAAAMVFLTAEAQWRRQGLTPYTKLQQLYQTYGYHESLNTYFVSPDVMTTGKLFEHIRGRSADQQRFVGSFPATRWRDMTTGYDSGTADNKPELLVDPTSHMLTIWSEPGVRFTLRGSGTEPKVKLYIESCCDSQEDAAKAVCDVFSAVLNDWVKPYAPSMTYASTLTTSSGRRFDVGSGTLSI